MKENFPEALAAVLVHEGGYVDHKDDPGGATNKGITHRTYRAWLAKNGLPTSKNVRHITDEEVAAIYKAQYWDAIKGDDLPSGVDYAVFDFAVNSGPARAAKFLQRIVGSGVDGVIGLQTLRSVSERAPKDIVLMLCQNRLAWLKKLRHWPTFGKGWSRRVNEVQAKAVRLTGKGAGYVGAQEASKAAQGKGDGPTTTTSAIKDALKDPKAIGGAIAVSLPSAGTILNGTGPVQWGIGGALLILALCFALWLWRSGRDE